MIKIISLVAVLAAGSAIAAPLNISHFVHTGLASKPSIVYGCVAPSQTIYTNTNNLTHFPATETSTVTFDRAGLGPFTSTTIIKAMGSNSVSSAGFSMCSIVKYDGQTYHVMKITDKVGISGSSAPSCDVTFTNFNHPNYSNLNFNSNLRCTPN